MSVLFRIEILPRIKLNLHAALSLFQFSSSANFKPALPARADKGSMHFVEPYSV
jgi:hypothetical protein